MSTPHVLLLKERKGADDSYAAVFDAHGWSTEFCPVLAFEFVNSLELRTCLLQPERYSGIVCTSQRAIEALIQVVAAPQVGSGLASIVNAQSAGDAPHCDDREALTDAVTTWRQRPFYVVGEASAKKAIEAGWPVDPSYQVSFFIAFCVLFSCY
jgi:uroporphyrinogen-III synthase